MTEPADATTPDSPRRTFNAMTILRIVLLIAPWMFIAYLYRDVNEVRDAFEEATPVLIAVALALVVLTVAGIGVLWMLLVEHLAGDRAKFIDKRQLLRSYARSWITRYIPGVAWIYGARFVHTQEGISRRVLATSMVDEFAMFSATTTAVGLGLWLWGAVNVWLGVGVLAITLPACVYFATNVNRLAHWALDHLGRRLPERWKSVAENLESGDSQGELNVASAARFTFGFALVAMASGLPFFFVLWSLTDISVSDLPRAAGSYNLAAMLSIAVIFVPAGLGVREASLAALMTPIVSEPVAATAALAFRVVTVVADGLFLLGAEALGRFGKIESPAGRPGDTEV